MEFNYQQANTFKKGICETEIKFLQTYDHDKGKIKNQE